MVARRPQYQLRSRLSPLRYPIRIAQCSVEPRSRVLRSDAVRPREFSSYCLELNESTDRLIADSNSSAPTLSKLSCPSFSVGCRISLKSPIINQSFSSDIDRAAVIPLQSCRASFHHRSFTIDHCKIKGVSTWIKHPCVYILLVRLEDRGAPLPLLPF